MSIMSTALKVLENVDDKISHKELIALVCNHTGNSYESVRGTLIKSNGGLLGLEDWQYLDGELIRCTPEQAGMIVNYQLKPKVSNWQTVREFLPSTITSLVTLGGEHGNCIEVFQPESALSYDYNKVVLHKLKTKFPWVNTEEGDIFSNTESFQVANIDLIGYMSMSLHTNLTSINNTLQYTYIVLTLQGQKHFRNHGPWVDRAREDYGHLEDPTLQLLKDTFSNYKLLHWDFYKRHARARRMRTLIWEVR